MPQTTIWNYSSLPLRIRIGKAKLASTVPPPPLPAFHEPLQALLVQDCPFWFSAESVSEAKRLFETTCNRTIRVLQFWSTGLFQNTNTLPLPPVPQTFQSSWVKTHLYRLPFRQENNVRIDPSQFYSIYFSYKCITNKTISRSPMTFVHCLIPALSNTCTFAQNRCSSITNECSGWVYHPKCYPIHLLCYRIYLLQTTHKLQTLISFALQSGALDLQGILRQAHRITSKWPWKL